MTIYVGYIISNSFGEDAVYEDVANWIIKIPAMLSRLEIAMRVCVIVCKGSNLTEHLQDIRRSNKL